MAGRKDDGDTAVLEPPAPVTAQVTPKFAVPLGRGGRGKSEWARWAYEEAILAGRQVVAADFDRTNPTLTAFLPAAVRPESSADEDVKAYLSRLIEAQIEKRHSLILDLGGGDQTLKQFAAEFPLVEFLAEHGVEAVAVHMIGPDLDDLAYLRDLEDEGLFAPAKTLLVLNDGVVPAGRSVLTAFERVREHRIIRAALDRGAKMASMPALSCMLDLDRARLGFAEAEKGVEKNGKSLGLIDRARVRTWRRAMTEAFAPVAGALP